MLKTPYRAPRANAFCERLIGSLKRECLDYLLVLHSRQLQHHVREFVTYYNHSRPHQGIDQRIPAHLRRHDSPNTRQDHFRPCVGRPPPLLHARRLTILATPHWCPQHSETPAASCCGRSGACLAGSTWPPAAVCGQAARASLSCRPAVPWLVAPGPRPRQPDLFASDPMDEQSSQDRGFSASCHDPWVPTKDENACAGGGALAWGQTCQH